MLAEVAAETSAQPKNRLNETSAVAESTHFRPDKPLFFAVLLALCWVQFSAAWIYPAIAFGDMVKGKPYGVPFQYFMWALIAATAALQIKAQGVLSSLRPLLPFAAFLLCGLVAGAIGFSPLVSLRLISFWLLMALAASAIGSALSVRRIEQVLCASMLATMLLSIALALAWPAAGRHLVGGEWRGLFTNKNQFGWIAALCLLTACGFARPGHYKLSGILGMSALTALIASSSKGALVVALMGMAYVAAFRLASRYLSIGSRALLLLVGTAVIAMAAIVLLPQLLPLLGKDASLTGRTDIWQAYFDAAMTAPWLGQGPGALTGPSPITLPLAYRLSGFGAIVTPHNMLLGAFGDAGLVGLLSFLLPLIWMVAVLPMTRPGPLTAACAAVAFGILGHGMVETHEVYGAGPGGFLLLLLYASSLRRTSEQGGEAEHGPRDKLSKPSGVALYKRGAT